MHINMKSVKVEWCPKAPLLNLHRLHCVLSGFSVGHAFSARKMSGAVSARLSWLVNGRAALGKRRASASPDAPPAKLPSAAPAAMPTVTPVAAPSLKPSIYSAPRKPLATVIHQQLRCRHAELTYSVQA